MKHNRKSRVKAAMLAASASVAALGMSDAAVTAVNFLGTGYAPLGATVTADAYGVAVADWTNQDVGNGAGTVTVNGMNFSWTCNNDWNQNGTATPGEGEVNFGYIDDTGNNSSLTITGLSGWLATIPGATAYTIQMIQASDNATGFPDTAVYDSNGGTSLGTFTNSTTGGGGKLGGATNTLTLTSDTIYIKPGNRAGSLRGTIAGVIITSVPEPSMAALLGLGGLALLLRRRK